MLRSVYRDPPHTLRRLARFMRLPVGKRIGFYIWFCISWGVTGAMGGVMGGAPLAASEATISEGAAISAPLNIVVLGNSLVAGYGLANAEGFVPQLQIAIDRALGAGRFNIVNAGVSGDTSAGGLSRLDWSIPTTTHAVIVSLGGNDALRAIAPRLTEENLAQIITRLQARHLPVMLVGMRAPINLGPEYGQAFDGLYRRLADRYHIPLYPFFLDGVAAEPHYNQADGIHPNAAGVEKIINAMHPMIIDFLRSTLPPA